jgi:phosphate transport system protein
MLNKQTDHIVKSFDEDLKHLNNVIAEMGGLAEAQLTRAVESLVRRNSELAAQVVLDDKRIDALETEVGQLTVRMLALRQPMAQDLREVVAAIKIASDIERIGDHATNIAEIVYFLVHGRSLDEERPKGDTTNVPIDA